MTTASDGSVYNEDTSRCGDFPECHDDNVPCGHGTENQTVYRVLFSQFDFVYAVLNATADEGYTTHHSLKNALLHYQDLDANRVRVVPLSESEFLDRVNWFLQDNATRG